MSDRAAAAGSAAADALSAAGSAGKRASSPAARKAKAATLTLGSSFSARDLPRSPRPSAPPLRLSLWSIDPHRVLREDGSPFTHDFDCLRMHGQQRIKVIVGITCYNEGWDEIRGTINGVVDNLSLLHGWHDRRARGLPIPSSVASVAESCSNLQPHEVAVVVIFDGREKVNPSLFGDADSPGFPVLSNAHRERMAAAAAALKATPRPATSDVRDLHLVELEYQPERSRGELAPIKINLLLAIKARAGARSCAPLCGRRRCMAAVADSP